MNTSNLFKPQDLSLRFIIAIIIIIIILLLLLIGDKGVLQRES